MIIPISDYLTIDETAAELGVSRRTIYNRIKDGRINAYQLGDRTFIHKRDLEVTNEVD